MCAVHDRARPDALQGSCDPRAFVPLAEEQEDAESFEHSRKFVACVAEQIVGFVGLEGTYLSWLYTVLGGGCCVSVSSILARVRRKILAFLHVHGIKARVFFG